MKKLKIAVKKQLKTKLNRLKKDKNKDTAAAIALSIQLDPLEEMEDAINDDLAAITAYASGDIIDQADLGDSPIAAKVKDASVDYANNRSSDLVDMLTDSTRDDIQSIIADGIENDLDTDTIANNIMDATSFSEDRATLIAETETTTAVNMGMIEGLRGMQEDSGVAATKEWSCAGDACEECQANQDAGPIPIDETFPSGDDAPAAHPNCNCDLIGGADDSDSSDSGDDQ